MRYGLVKQVREKKMPIRLSCRALGVSSSGYYVWVKGMRRRERAKKDEALIIRIEQIHRESLSTYGEPRIRASLRAEGIRCGKNRIARIMRQAGISGVNRKRYRVKTTDSRHDLIFLRIYGHAGSSFEQNR